MQMEDDIYMRVRVDIETSEMTSTDPTTQELVVAQVHKARDEQQILIICSLKTETSDATSNTYTIGKICGLHSSIVET